jgi:2-polyprenyl-3-methyl-5-hydroxy-6-metoxy-1,4-benzoquinol methylase
MIEFSKNPIKIEENGILKFVENDNYTASFGYQWNKFQKTQLDRFGNDVYQSSSRLLAETAWVVETLEEANILEVGSGAGRFTRALLENTKANVFSVDYSAAVEVNFENNSVYGTRLHLCQASIYELPYKPQQFDKVICFGVLQHTPDFKRSVRCLAEMVKKGGELVVDFYPVKGWWTKIHAKYIFRPLTKRMSHQSLLALLERNISWLIKLYQIFEAVGIGRVANRFVPICDIKNTLPKGLSEHQLKEWALLDTFDMFSPVHDHPQKIETVKKWMAEAGLKVTFGAFISLEAGQAAVVRGVRT